MDVGIANLQRWIRDLEEFHLIPPHAGRGKFLGGFGELECKLFVRPDGECRILATGPRASLPLSALSAIEFSGEGEEGSFVVAGESMWSNAGYVDEIGWGLFSPVNKPLTITYRAGRFMRSNQTC
jgi:hypothetical protein